MENYPFTKCLDPQKIRNPYTGDTLIVGCGKCEACNMQKSSIRSLKCKLESMSHCYTYFVTLTYRDEDIPRMMPFKPVGIADLKSEKKFYFIDVTPRMYPNGEYDEELTEVISESEMSLPQIDVLRKKCNLGETLPYLCKRDLQLFMKRLRKHLSKYSNEKIRYYACGEYGPVHFRPHFHLLLWFSQRETQAKIHECIYKSWQFGRIDIQATKGDATSYVAGYLTSFNNLPRVFKIGKARPFACHSRFLGEAILKAEKEEVYKLSVEDFIRRSIIINGSNTEFSLWRSFKTWFYPRCPQYSTRNHDERFTSFRTYGAAAELFGKVSPLQAARKIVDYILDDKPRLPIIDYFAKSYNINKFIGKTVYERTVRSVYLELRTSEHFLEFVCDGIDNIYHQQQCLSMIERFYEKCDLLGLGNQLVEQNEFLKYDGFELDDIKYFYWNVRYDSDMFKNTKIFREFREQQLNKHRQSIKHKYLNDKNKIFCDM